MTKPLELYLSISRNADIIDALRIKEYLSRLENVKIIPGNSQFRDKQYDVIIIVPPRTFKNNDEDWGITSFSVGKGQAEEIDYFRHSNKNSNIFIFDGLKEEFFSGNSILFTKFLDENWQTKYKQYSFAPGDTPYYFNNLCDDYKLMLKSTIQIQPYKYDFSLLPIYKRMRSK